MVEDTNLPVVTKATILVVQPLLDGSRQSHYFNNPPFGGSLFKQYGGWQDQFSGVRRSHYLSDLAIGPPPHATPLVEPPVLVVYLKYKLN